MIIPGHALTISPVQADELEAVLAVYRQCEDFLALGPVASASLEMVRADIELSQAEGGLFCGIHAADGRMIGVLDYTLRGHAGEPCAAYLSLLMIAAPFRSRGLGHAILQGLEAEIRRDPSVTTFRLGVQVNNPRALHFWQQHGFRIVSGPTLMPDQTTAFAMRKDLI